MSGKIKNLINVFSKITICVLVASAAYITAFWGWNAQISVQILWQILVVSAVCSIPILMYPRDGEKELSKKGMIVRQILYFIYVNIAVLGLGRLFGWFYFTNMKMLAFMEALIVFVYVTALGKWVTDLANSRFCASGSYFALLRSGLASLAVIIVYHTVPSM